MYHTLMKMEVENEKPRYYPAIREMPNKCMYVQKVVSQQNMLKTTNAVFSERACNEKCTLKCIPQDKCIQVCIQIFLYAAKFPRQGLGYKSLTSDFARY